MLKQLFKVLLQFIFDQEYRRRWINHPELRSDVNFMRWGVATSDIPGSHCGCCGNWMEGDPGDPSYPPNWRWTLCLNSFLN